MVKIKQTEAKQILIDFGLMPKDDFHAVNLANFKRQAFENDVVIYEFDYRKQHLALVIDNYATDDLKFIKQNLIWADQAEVLANPQNPVTFGYRFEQKTLYLVRQQANKIRLDQLAAEKFTDYSRSRLQKMIKKGLVKVDNQIITAPNKLVDLTSQLDLDYKPPIKQSIPLEIIFENNDFLAINKPAGVLTHAKNKDDLEYTVADFVKDYLKVKSDNLRWGIVHRLDRLTSGVLICAKNETAFNYLKQQFKNRQIQKTYLAIVTDKLKNDEALVKLPLARSVKNPSRFQVDPNGKVAETYYQVLKRFDGQALVKLSPKTGRTHQLRAHLAYLNSPIVGDKLYGGAKNQRMMLHAQSLELTDCNGQSLQINAPTPKEFKL